MSAFVFVGPTLEAEEARTILDATYLPPASQGDVFRLVATTNVQVIGLIDGNFLGVPSVWHKELLWAMHEGVHVIGAASMGALRAAELADFGMEGEGRIYEAYRTGVLSPYDTPFEDDDEVAIIHAPAELGYRPLSNALVDIRCALDLACRKNVISLPLRDRLVKLGKSCFYPDRSYHTLLALALKDGWPPSELERLRGWLPRGCVSQKKQDALAMLARIAAGNYSAGKQVTFSFHHTTMWERFTSDALTHDLTAVENALSEEELAVLAEVRLRPGEFRRIKRTAETSLRIGACSPVRRVALAMLNVTRLEGTYEAFALRAARKKLLLADRAMPRARDLEGLAALQLLDWYFTRRLGDDLPDYVDAFAQSVGYRNREALLDALLLEYAFLSANEESESG